MTPREDEDGDDNVRPFGWVIDPDDLATEKVDDEAVISDYRQADADPQYDRRREERRQAWRPARRNSTTK